MNQKIKEWLLAGSIGALLVGGIAILYLFNMPHRDVQASATDYELDASELMREFLEHSNSAYEKYLEENGNSKIIAVSGTVYSIDEDMNGQQVIILKEDMDPAGVSCTFMASTNTNASTLKKGDEVKIKGVIRSGAAYDEDLELYEDVVLEKCDIIR